MSSHGADLGDHPVLGVVRDDRHPVVGKIRAVRDRSDLLAVGPFDGPCGTGSLASWVAFHLGRACKDDRHEPPETQTMTGTTKSAIRE